VEPVPMDRPERIRSEFQGMKPGMPQSIATVKLPRITALAVVTCLSLSGILRSLLTARCMVAASSTLLSENKRLGQARNTNVQLGATSQQGTHWPSVGIVVSTYERPEFLLEALGQMALQDYPGTIEAVVIDDSAQSMEAQIAAARQQGSALPELQYIYLPERASIGAKRNLAIRSTSAEVLCVWDDDDVFTIDRVRKQVEHLQGGNGVLCSAIEVSAMFCVPTNSLSLRPPRLPQLFYENTLCFSRKWWESRAYMFGEPWEVSGQGEGTLEDWWEEVCPLTGIEEPFLYIYLPTSVSGGTPVYIDPHPEPDHRMNSLVSALRQNRFPDCDRLAGNAQHVRKVLSGARCSLMQMLKDPDLFAAGRAGQNFDAFRSQYART